MTIKDPIGPTRAMRCHVPALDFSVNLTCMPMRPNSGFGVQDIKPL